MYTIIATLKSGLQVTQDH